MKNAGQSKPNNPLPGSVSRRVLDAIKRVHEDMAERDDDELPQIPAGVLMKKGRPEGGQLGQ